MAEGESHFINPMALLTIRIAEETMKRLSSFTDRKVQSNVDWLTEVVRRLSESAMARDLSNSIKVLTMRLKKVHLMAFSWL